MRMPLLVDLSEADDFLGEQLQPWRLRDACAARGHPLQPGIHPRSDLGC